MDPCLALAHGGPKAMPRAEGRRSKPRPEGRGGMERDWLKRMDQCDEGRGVRVGHCVERFEDHES